MIKLKNLKKRTVIFVACMCLLGACTDIEKELANMNEGSYSEQGIHLLFSENKVTEEGYWILKANKHAARILLPERRWNENQLDCKWYAGDDNSLLNHGFGNSSGTIRNGKEYVDGFYYCQPKNEFRAPLKLVKAWYEIEKSMRSNTDSHEVNKQIEEKLHDKYPEFFN